MVFILLFSAELSVKICPKGEFISINSSVPPVDQHDLRPQVFWGGVENVFNG